MIVVKIQLFLESTVASEPESRSETILEEKRTQATVRKGY